VRATLGSALAVDAATLLIDRDAHGKPQLAGALCDWQFSLSHSGGWVLLALALGQPVGVDLESLRPRERLLALAQRFFTSTEANALHNLPETERLRAFYALWTAKEAVLKAAGVGIGYGLAKAGMVWRENCWVIDQFADMLAPATAWQLHRLVLPAPLLGHLAWRGPQRLVRLIDTTS
jgi:4'-phosphopantetheinyl transferase